MQAYLGKPIPSLRRAYAASVVLGGVGSHLASEFAAMGLSAGRITFSPLHLYLGAAFLAALAVLAHDVLGIIRGASNRCDAKRVATLGLSTLPFAGKRGFWLTTALAQFAIAWATVTAEGSPLFSHDIAIGVIGALVTAVVLALFTRMLGRRLPSIAAAIVELEQVESANTTRWTRVDNPKTGHVDESVWNAHLFNRPPPQLQSA